MDVTKFWLTFFAAQLYIGLIIVLLCIQETKMKHLTEHEKILWDYIRKLEMEIVDLRARIWNLEWREKNGYQKQ